ncbi:hypothetical protein [Bradyrhizobium stylosanthis]|uniref:hypothetical protein n=1 Tax=Bradyrhizobium stylosanthis TaxID=1803665 RepID=UPI0007C4AD4A|nr:hypothetical protein [Bradyrhizobium stylosanthis]
MPFRPLNDDHAIHSAAFGIALSQPIAWSSIEAVIKSALDWRRELPAIDLPQYVDVQINPNTGAPGGRLVRGVEFSHKRPDGSASWLLSILNNEIKVVATVYTRWQPTWAKAGDILIGAVEQLALHEKDRNNTITGNSLIVTDVFLCDDETPNYVELFGSSREIAPAIFERGRLWHNHTGWFAERPSGNILNQLNVDVRPNAGDMVIRGAPDEMLRVVVQHTQLFRPTEPPLLSPSDKLEDAIASEFPVMHDANKAVMRSLLSLDIQTTINLST